MNVLKLLYYRIKGRNYPSRLLPKCRYLINLDFDSLVQTADFNIIYRSNYSREESFNELNNVKSKVFELSQVSTLSMNLLGGKFEIDHIKYRPAMHSRAVERWEGDRVYLSDYIKDCDTLECYSPIIYRAIHLHNIDVPFSLNTTDKEANKIVKKLLNKLTLEKEIFHFNGKLFITHDPTNINYWHVELKLIDYNIPPKVISSVKSKSNNFAAKFILDHILTVHGRPAMSIQRVEKTSYARK